MAQEVLCYQPTDSDREGLLAQIAELITIANKDPALGVCRGAEAPDLPMGQQDQGARHANVPPAKKVDSCVALSPHGEPSYHIVQRALEDAHVSLECHRENHHHAIDDMREAGKNVKVSGELVYNLGCLVLIRPVCYVVWPNKFRPDVASRYDNSSNPVEFLQLYIVAVQAARGN
jgi:hypothetical protein